MKLQQLAVLVIASLVLGILGLALVTAIPSLFEGNLVVDSYDAVLYENGTLTEHYTYDVKTSGQYRMLYRSWEAPLTFAPVPHPSVEIRSASPPDGTVAYAKNDSGRCNCLWRFHQGCIKINDQSIGPYKRSWDFQTRLF